jgi:hypothetical protein
MGTKALATWEQCTKQLQILAADPASAASAVAAGRILVLCDKLDTLPAPPKAVWKKLIQQLKVRLPPLPLTLSVEHVTFSSAAERT